MKASPCAGTLCVMRDASTLHAQAESHCVPAAPLRLLDRRLFALLGAGQAPRPFWLATALLVSRWSWVPMLVLMLAIARLSPQGLPILIGCLVSAGVVQLGGKRLARRWQARRPFMDGLSPNHLQHSLRPGFPSTHAMVMGCVTGFMASCVPAHLGVPGLALLSVATGWARVYAGAHYPLDVLAGLLLGAACGAALAAVLLIGPLAG